MESGRPVLAQRHGAPSRPAPHDARRSRVLPDDRVVDGSPVSRSQTTVVSRWLVMPIAEMSPASSVGVGQRAADHLAGARQISSASCSTQPAFGVICSCSRWST